MTDKSCLESISVLSVIKVVRGNRNMTLEMLYSCERRSWFFGFCFSTLPHTSQLSSD